MKKSFITLLLTSGLVAAAELNYTGSNNGWFEQASNWTNVETGSQSSAKPQNGDTLRIGDDMTTKAVKLGNNNGTHQFSNMTITIAEGSTLLLDGSYNDVFSGCTLNVDGTLTSSTAKAYVNTSSVVNIGKNGKVVLTASDAKIGGGTIWNINSEQGLTLGASWLDNNTSQGLLTFNLGEKGSVLYDGQVKLNSFNGYSLSAVCSVGVLEGSGEVSTYTRELVKFNQGITLNGGTIAALNAALSGTFTLNGTTLTSGELTEAGHYNLAYDEVSKSILLSYSAYSVPEPTTATLSLLALAGLAARRRRL